MNVIAALPLGPLAKRNGGHAMKLFIYIAGTALALSTTGCATRYYRITDIQSGQEFYTRGWLPGMYGRYGSIRFTELDSGDRITLQASRAHPISEQEAHAASLKGAAGGRTATTQP